MTGFDHERTEPLVSHLPAQWIVWLCLSSDSGCVQAPALVLLVCTVVFGQNLVLRENRDTCDLHNACLAPKVLRPPCQLARHVLWGCVVEGTGTPGLFGPIPPDLYGVAGHCNASVDTAMQWVLTPVLNIGSTAAGFGASVLGLRLVLGAQGKAQTV